LTHNRIQVILIGELANVKLHMPSNIPLVTIETDDVPLIALGTDYVHGTLLDWHEHSRAQFLYSASGSMKVDTKSQTWVVPVQRGVWIPAGETHRVLMLGASTRSLYIDSGLAVRAGRSCEVLHVGGNFCSKLCRCLCNMKKVGEMPRLFRFCFMSLKQRPALTCNYLCPALGGRSRYCVMSF